MSNADARHFDKRKHLRRHSRYCKRNIALRKREGLFPASEFVLTSIRFITFAARASCIEAPGNFHA